MAGDLDLGQHLDLQRLGPRQNPRHVRFGVTSARSNAPTEQPRYQMPLTPHFGALPDFRRASHLQAKRFVVREMPVKPVQLQQRHQVQEPQDRLDPIEMPRAVQMLSAPAKARRVPDHPAGQVALTGLAQRHQGDAGVKQTLITATDNVDPFRPQHDLISPFRQVSVAFQRHRQPRRVKKWRKVQSPRQIIHRLQPYVAAGKAHRPQAATRRHPGRRLRHQPQPRELRHDPGRRRLNPHPGFGARQRHHPALGAQIGPQRQPRPVLRRESRLAASQNHLDLAPRRDVRQRHLGIARHRPHQRPPRTTTEGTNIEQHRIGAEMAMSEPISQ